MFSLAAGFTEVFIMLLVALSPLLAIAFIIALVVRSKNKETTETNKNSSLNVLLYLGSILIIGSTFAAASSAPDFFPFFLIFITLITYIAGVGLYRTVSYLRPVASALTYTAIILLPFSHSAFTQIGLDNATSLAISTVTTTIGYLVACIGIESSILGWLSYIWLIFSGWTLGNIAGGYVFDYFFYIWPLFVSIIPTALWSLRVNWLPIALRKATRSLGIFLAPIWSLFCICLLFESSVQANTPFLRTITAAIAIFPIAIGLINNKQRSQKIFVRAAIQWFLLAISADLLSCGINTCSNTNMSIIFTAIWLVSFLIQAVISILVPQVEDDHRKAESVMLIASLAAIFCSTEIIADPTRTTQGAISIAIAAIIAILGILSAWRRKNIAWCIATAVAVMYIPYILGYIIPIRPWSSSILAIIYASISLLFVAIYALIRNIQPEKSLIFARVTMFTAIGVSLFFALDSISGNSHNYDLAICFAFAAASNLLLSLLSRRHHNYEWAIYSAALSAGLFCDPTIDVISWYSSPAQLTLRALQISIIGLTVFGVGLYKERSEKKLARTIIGFIIVNAGMLDLCLESNSGYICPFILIIESIVFVLVGVIRKYRWMAIASTIIAALTTMHCTGGMNFIWLTILGIALIAFVVYQMVKNNQGGNNSGDNTPSAPEAPNQEQ